MDSAKRVISGTFGEVWLDSDKIAEIISCQLKYAYTKEAVNIAGQMAEDSKIVSVKGTGTIRMHKVNSRLVIKLHDGILSGKDVRFTVISKLADPDAYGAERVAAYNCSFDDLTMADWELAKKGEITAPFTFTKTEFLDKIAS